jgi:integrase
MSSTGIQKRHARSCGTRNDRACTCTPTFQANVWSARERRRIFKTFPTYAAAKSWRSDALVAIRKGTMRAPAVTTLREAAEAWLEGARAGAIRTRSGDIFKPSTLRSYEIGLRLHVLDELGGARLSDIARADLQDLIDRMLMKRHARNCPAPAGGDCCCEPKSTDPSTIRNTLMPVRAIYRRAVARGEIAVNPTSGLELPAVRGKRDRIASPAEAAKLIAAVPEADRALWATAFYSGLRLGELRALRWEDIDLANGVIRVERSWDKVVGAVEPKSRAGRRSVPIAGVLRDYLVEHKLRCPWNEGLAFGASPTEPFNEWANLRDAERAWKKAKLARITPHQCRHTFASLMIAAGVNAKALSTYMGHSSVTITYDRYGHLMPGNEDEAAELLDAYLKRAQVVQKVPTVAPVVAQSN